jgi:hypothetical protein
MLSLALVLAVSAAKKPYSIDALFVEGCSCKGVCSAEITGVDVGCRGVGAMKFYKASYGGADFSGTLAAWAWGPSGEWVRIYVQSPAKKRAAVIGFMTAALESWGKLVSVKDAAIEIQGANGSYQAMVNDGEVMSLSTKPVLGANGKGVLISNLPSPFHSAVTQGQTVRAVFKDGMDPFDLEATSAFTYPHCVMKGRV